MPPSRLKSPARRVHAASKRARQELLQAYRIFASELLDTDSSA
jgi:hypothetical protein